MAIKCTCSNCSHAFEVPDECFGKKVNCSSCGNAVSIELGFSDDDFSDNNTQSEDIYDDPTLDIDDNDTGIDLDADITIPDDLDDLAEDNLKPVPEYVPPARKVDNDTGVSLEPIVTGVGQKNKLPILIGALVVLVGVYLLFMRKYEAPPITVSKVVDLAPDNLNGAIVVNYESLKKLFDKNSRKFVSNLFRSLPKGTPFSEGSLKQVFIYTSGEQQKPNVEMFIIGKFISERFQEFSSNYQGYNIGILEVPKTKNKTYYTLLQKDLLALADSKKRLERVIDRYDSESYSETGFDLNFLKSGTNKIPYIFKIHGKIDLKELRKIPQFEQIPQEYRSYISLYQMSFEIGHNKKEGYIYFKGAFEDRVVANRLYKFLLEQRQNLLNYVQSFETKRIKNSAELLNKINFHTEEDSLIMNWNLDSKFIDEMKWLGSEGRSKIPEEVTWSQYNDKSFATLQEEITYLELFLNKYPVGIYSEQVKEHINSLKQEMFADETKILYKQYLSRTNPKIPLQNWVVWNEFPLEKYTGLPIVDKVHKHISNSKENILRDINNLHSAMKQINAKKNYEKMDNEFNVTYNSFFSKDNFAILKKLFSKDKKTSALFRRISALHRKMGTGHAKYIKQKQKQNAIETKRISTLVSSFFDSSYYEYLTNKDYQGARTRILDYKKTLTKLNSSLWNAKLDQALKDLIELEKTDVLIYKKLRSLKRSKKKVLLATTSGKLRSGIVVSTKKRTFLLKTYSSVEKYKYREIKAQYMFKLLESKHLGNSDVSYSLGLLLYSYAKTKNSNTELRLAKRCLESAIKAGNSKAKELLLLFDKK